ncbi:condensation domain-containing protein [Streptomyces noursei]|uniref:condensation domain-containing protein n=1 Tax=Streptomyces noursei TaxID=1971 RepID=UPI003327D259
MTSDRAAAAARLAKLDPAQRAALAARLVAARSGPPLRTRPGPRKRFPLGMDQERLWILDELDPGTTTYTLGFGLRFHGAFDLDVFTRAAHAVARRHELLRSGVETEDGKPYLLVHPDRGADVTFADVSDGRADEVEERRAAFVAEQVRRPFDLRHDPVLRLAVGRVADGDHQVVQTMPHSFTDQWSYVRLNHELIEHYRAYLEGVEPQVPVLPVQFGDYAQWQRDYFASPKGEEHRAFWRTYLAGAPTRLPLPYDATPDTSDHAGEQYNFILDEDVAAAFTARAGEARTTMATAMTAAYVALLHEETGARDIVVGVPSVTRGEDAVQDLIGFLLTNVPIRVRLPEHPTPAQVLAATVEGAVAVADHREVPFGEIVKAVAPNRSVTQYPLLQTMLVQLNLGDSVLFKVPGADVYANAVPEGISSMDMTVAWWQVNGLMYGRIEYRTALFLPSTIERLARRLLQLVELFAKSPDTPLRTRTVPPASPVVSVLAPPVAPAEPDTGPVEGIERVERAWREALGVSEAVPGDVFFEVGGTSLLAVRLTHLLKAEGFTLTLRDVFSNPTLGGLARVVLARDRQGAAEDGEAPLGPLGPEQELLYDSGLERVEDFAHTFVLRSNETLDAGRLEAAAKAVVAAHPGLSTEFRTCPEGRRARVGDRWSWRVEAPGSEPRDVAAVQRAAFDAESGALFAVSLIPGGTDETVADLVVISANHLVIDGMSWGIIVADLTRAYRGQVLIPEPAGQLEYAAVLRTLDPSPQADFWAARLAAVRPVNWGTPELAEGIGQFEVAVPLAGRPGSLEAEAFTAVARALRPHTEEVVVSTMGLGREPLPTLRNWDPTRAVGYYACPYPLHLPLTGGTPHEDLAAVGTALRHTPDGGKTYGLLRSCADTALRARFAGLSTPRIVVNYLGALAEPAEASEGLFTGAGEFAAEEHRPAGRDVDVDVAVGIQAGEAVFRWLYDPARVTESTVREMAARAAADLTELLAAHGEPDDVPGTVGVSEEQMNQLFAELSDVRLEQQ